jgi:hypothetical protein
VRPTPIKPAPVKPAPFKPTPVRPTPVKPVPVKPAPAATPNPVNPNPLPPVVINNNDPVNINNRRININEPINIDNRRININEPANIDPPIAIDPPVVFQPPVVIEAPTPIDPPVIVAAAPVSEPSTMIVDNFGNDGAGTGDGSVDATDPANVTVYDLFYNDNDGQPQLYGQFNVIVDDTGLVTDDGGLQDAKDDLTNQGIDFWVQADQDVQNAMVATTVTP